MSPSAQLCPTLITLENDRENGPFAGGGLGKTPCREAHAGASYLSSLINGKDGPVDCDSLVDRPVHSPGQCTGLGSVSEY